MSKTHLSHKASKCHQSFTKQVYYSLYKEWPCIVSHATHLKVKDLVNHHEFEKGGRVGIYLSTRPVMSTKTKLQRTKRGVAQVGYFLSTRARRSTRKGFIPHKVRSRTNHRTGPENRNSNKKKGHRSCKWNLNVASHALQL